MQFDKMSEEILHQASKVIPTALTALLQVGRQWANSRDLLNHTKEYKHRLEVECSQMQILGMEQPIPLDDVYTEVRIVNRVQSRMFKTIAELESETRRQVERRSLKAIEEKVRKRVESEIRKEISQVGANQLTENFRTELKQLRLEQRKLFFSLYPNCDESMEVVIARLKDNYKSRLTALHRATKAEREYKKRQKQDRPDTTQRLPSLVGRDHFLNHDEVNLDLSETPEELKAEVLRATASLSEIEDAYRDLYLVFETKARKLISEKQKKLRKLKQESDETPLTSYEERRLATQIAVEIEKELTEATHREVVQRVFEDFGHAVHSDEQPQPAWEAIVQRSRSLILGQPGAGKTTFLKYVVLKHLRESTEQPKLPLLVTLREFSSSGCRSLLDYIAQGFADCGFPSADAFVERLLQSNHKCILLFDGLDEVSHGQQDDIVAEIVKLSRRYRRNQFVVSCRTANFRGQLNGFAEFEIAEFGYEQVAMFVSGWFSENQTLANEFLTEIKKHAGLSELTTTPLLLALLCIGYRRNQKFPAQKALIYLASLDALLVDWDSSKQLRRQSFVSNFDSESKKQLLAKVACDTFCEESLFFSQAEIVALFDEDSSAFPIPPRNGERILREYVENHGLMVERAKGIYSFSHLTLQEFLTALHLSRNQPLSVLERLVEEAWQDARWKETVVFLGGLLPRADMFVVCLRNHIKAQIAESALRLLFVPEQLPLSADQYISFRSNREAWVAWFRWRLFEYQLHQASYGTEREGITARLGMLGVSSLIGHALGLTESLRHPLHLDRPLNAVVAAAFAELKKPGTGKLLSNEEKTLTSYLSLVEMLAEILASGVKIENSIRLRVLLDIAQHSTDKWPYPIPTRRNRLGA